MDAQPATWLTRRDADEPNISWTTKSMALFKSRDKLILGVARLLVAVLAFIMIIWKKNVDEIIRYNEF